MICFKSHSVLSSVARTLGIDSLQIICSLFRYMVSAVAFHYAKRLTIAMKMFFYICIYKCIYIGMLESSLLALPHLYSTTSCYPTQYASTEYLVSAAK